MLARYRQNRPGTPLVNMLLYQAGWLLGALVTIILYRRRRRHPQRVPARGPVLLVANHQSYLDPLLIGSAITTRHIDFIGRMGLFKSRAFGALIAAVNCTPIKEEGGDVAAMKEVLRRLADGRAVLIFPEGSRTSDGAVHEFKRGGAVLIRRAACPVVPVAVEGCFDAWPRTRKFPRLFGGHVAVAFGEPIDPDRLMAHGPDAAMAQLRDQINEMRLQLRAEMRLQSARTFPPPGPADR